MRLVCSVLPDQGVYKLQRRLLLSHLVYHVFYDQSLFVHRELVYQYLFASNLGSLCIVRLVLSLIHISEPTRQS